MAPLLPPVIHPVLVHAPIVLLPTAALLATLAATRRYPWAAPAAVLVLVLAAVGAGAATLSGLQEFEAIEEDIEGTEAYEVGETHETLGIATAIAAGIAAVGLLLVRRRWPTASWRWAVVALLWALAILVLVTGWYGGRLPYEFGIGMPERPPA